MRTLLVAIAASVVLNASAEAQLNPRPLVGAGTFSPVDDPGLHLLGGVSYFGQRTLYPRAEMVLEQARTRNILLVGSIVYSPLRRPAAPYAILGVGASMDGRTSALMSGGLGIRFVRAWVRPLSVEARIASGPRAHMLVTAIMEP